ncbi:MAG: Rab family GTPase [Candidatus Hodarchaeota archaeon]
MQYSWKLIVGGQSSVGKTTLLHRYIHKHFKEGMKLTIGVEFHTQLLERNHDMIHLVLWDLGGHERFRFFQLKYLIGTKGAFLVFDMSRPETLDQINDWTEIIKSETDPETSILLVGSKMDLLNEAEISKVDELAWQKVKEVGLDHYIPTSSKSNINVNEAILWMVDALSERFKEK